MPTLRINQFLVESELALPCAPLLTAPGGELLRVRRAQEVPPASSCAPVEGSVRFQQVADAVLLSVEERIVLKVDEKGQEIEVHARDEHLQEAALYVVGAGMALCTALRGDVPLHASSVELDGHRIGFLAPCGTGKSTTLWEFLEAGALFANDDLVPMRLCDRSAMATSCISLFPKIGGELMERCQRDWEGCPEILPGRNKLWLPISAARRAPESGPLTALFALQPFEPQERRSRFCANWVQVQAQRGMQAISLLAGNSMTGNILPSIVGTQKLMQNFARLAEAVPVYTVRYPRRFEALPYVVEAVRQTLASARA